MQNETETRQGDDRVRFAISLRNPGDETKKGQWTKG